MKFYFTTYVQYFDMNGWSYYDDHGNYIGGGHWVIWFNETYIRDYKKLSYHSLKVTDIGSYSHTGYIKTSKTAYQRFKLKRAH